MPKSYRHLAYEERCQVENPKKSGLSKGSIAQHPTLISDQITPYTGIRADCCTSEWKRDSRMPDRHPKETVHLRTGENLPQRIKGGQFKLDPYPESP